MFILAAKRILVPCPMYTIAEWYQRTYMPELLGVDLPPDSAYQMLMQCRDYLADDVPMEIEMALAGWITESFHLKPESFNYDVTSTFVEGEGGAGILQCGYSTDHRPDCRQVNYSLCVTVNPTVPLFHQAFPGNTVDSKTTKETMVRFKGCLGLDGCLVVDRSIVTSANIVETVDERKLDFVGGRGGRHLKWELKEAALNEDVILDGRHWFVTMLDDSPKNVIETYRARDAVERGFRISKDAIKMRSVWNRTEQHIKATCSSASLRTCCTRFWRLKRGRRYLALSGRRPWTG